MESNKTPGQLAYEATKPEKPWNELGRVTQSSWERNPNRRWGVK